MTARMIKILFVEDDLVDRMALERLFRNHSQQYECRVASSIEAARKVLEIEQFDVAVMDYVLGGGISFELFGDLPNIPIIITTGNGSEEIAVKARQAGAYAYLIKDLAGTYLEALSLTIEQVTQQKRETRDW